MDALASVAPRPIRMTEYRPGFGLLRLLMEMREGSHPSARIEFAKAPRLTSVDDRLALGSSPDGAQRNVDCHGDKLGDMSDRRHQLLCGPQTYAGPLVAVRPEDDRGFHATVAGHGLGLQSIGSLHETTAPVRVEVC